MKPGKIEVGSVKPEVVGNEHVKEVLQILNKQLDILRLLGQPALYIPTGIDGQRSNSASTAKEEK